MVSSFAVSGVGVEVTEVGTGATVFVSGTALFVPVHDVHSEDIVDICPAHPARRRQ